MKTSGTLPLSPVIVAAAWIATIIGIGGCQQPAGMPAPQAAVSASEVKPAQEEAVLELLDAYVAMLFDSEKDKLFVAFREKGFRATIANIDAPVSFYGAPIEGGGTFWTPRGDLEEEEYHAYRIEASLVTTALMRAAGDGLLGDGRAWDAPSTAAERRMDKEFGLEGLRIAAQVAGEKPAMAHALGRTADEFITALLRVDGVDTPFHHDKPASWGCVASTDARRTGTSAADLAELQAECAGAAMRLLVALKEDRNFRFDEELARCHPVIVRAAAREQARAGHAKDASIWVDRIVSPEAKAQAKLSIAEAATLGK
jgi:hypothetical protein